MVKAVPLPQDEVAEWLRLYTSHRTRWPRLYTSHRTRWPSGQGCTPHTGRGGRVVKAVHLTQDEVAKAVPLPQDEVVEWLRLYPSYRTRWPSG